MLSTPMQRLAMGSVCVCVVGGVEVKYRVQSLSSSIHTHRAKNAVLILTSSSSCRPLTQNSYSIWELKSYFPGQNKGQS